MDTFPISLALPYLRGLANGPEPQPVDSDDMGTEKRERQKANRQTRLAEVQAEEAKEVREASTKKYGKIAAVVAATTCMVPTTFMSRIWRQTSSGVSAIPPR